MINYVVSEIFQSPAKVLVNTVNTVGVMGKGIAKEFKFFYPEMFAEYQNLCERGQFQIGQLWLYKTPRKWVLNFPTKKHWRQPSKPEYIELGLQKFVETYMDNGINSISFPMPGCGNGELDWEGVVRPLMDKYLKNLPVEIFIHLRGRDQFIPEHHDLIAMRLWLRSEPESLAFTEVWEDLYAVVTKGKQFKTIENETFVAEISKQDDPGIELKNNQGTILLYKDALLDLWQHIRSLGFCTDRTMPSGLDRYASYIVALLSNLSYLKPMTFVIKGKHSVGLRLELPPRRCVINTPVVPVKEIELV
ncbi:MAG: macro domain-containing protein [Chloroflexi bacterium]|nr:macro domain-containing protein [Chloroflexota bacterium]